MRTIQKVELRDVFGFQNVSLEIPERGCFLVMGNNLDDPGSRSNDSGKSAFLDAVTWVFTGQFPRRKVSADRVIRDGQKRAIGSVYLSDGTVVTRERAANSKVFSFTGCNHDLPDGQKQQQLASLLGVRDLYQYIMSAVYFNFAQYTAFADPDMTSAQRLELFSNMFRLQRYTAAGKKAGEQYGVLRDKVQMLQARKGELTAAIESAGVLSAAERQTIETSLQDLMTRGSADKSRIAELEQQLRQYGEWINLLAGVKAKASMLDQDIRYTEVSIDKLKASIEATGIDRILQEKAAAEKTADSLRPAVTRSAQLMAAMQEIQVQQSEAAASRRLIDGKIKLLDQLKNLSCPKCSAELALSLSGEPTLLDPAAVQNDRSAILQELDAVSRTQQDLQDRAAETKRQKTQADQSVQQLQTLEAQLRNLEKELDRIEGFRLTMVERQAELARKQRDRAALDQESAELSQHAGSRVDNTGVTVLLADVRKSFALLTQQYYDVKARVDHDTAARQKMQTATADLQTVEQQIAAIGTNVEDLAKFREGFPRVRNEIMARLVPTVQGSTNQYLQLLDTDVRVTFNMDAEKTAGVFELMIFADGQDWPYDSRGRGKRTRIAVSTALSIRDLYMRAVAEPLGFLFMDEVADHMDDTGILNFFELMRGLPGQTFCISHSDTMQDLFDNVVVVEKANGISSVRWAR